MPGSTDIGKEDILKWFRNKRDIRSILDMGVGEGTYAKLLGPGYSWFGIEVWEPYVEKFNLHELYDGLVVGDLREVEWPKTDCIIFGDVLEHLSKEDVFKTLEKAQKYNHCIISIPTGPWPQGEIDGNLFETHLSEWDEASLIEMLPGWEHKIYPHFAVFLR